MALQFAGFTIVLVLLFVGHLPSSVLSQFQPQQTTSALLNYGVVNGDNFLPDVSNGEIIDLQFNIQFLGFNYSKLYISADGTLGFEKQVDYNKDFDYEGIIPQSADLPFIAPLLHNGYRPYKMQPDDYQGKISYRVVYFSSQDIYNNKQLYDTKEYLLKTLRETVITLPDNFDAKFVVLVTWENVAERTETGVCGGSTRCNSTTFQLALTGDSINTYAVFNYDHYDISVQNNYQAGFNAGRGRGWYNVLPCHGGCSKYLSAAAIKNLGTYYGSDRKGRYIFSVGREMIRREGCLDKALPYGIMEVYPRTVGMFGGEKLEVSGQCGSRGAPIFCRFGSAAERNPIVVTGAMVNSMKGYCPVPLLYRTGQVDIYWSSDGITWSAYQTINVVLPSRLEADIVVEKAVKEDWYKRDTKQITVKWNPSTFIKNGTTNSFNIKIIGYREYDSKVEYQELETIIVPENSRGTYTINVDQHHCTKDCDKFEIGLLEVSLATQFHEIASQRVAVRYGPIPLGWYVNQELVNSRGSDWSDQKCYEWRDADSRNKQWLGELLPCPCSLDQALADFGRWQTDPGCNLFTGSQCTFHQGAKHCVRSVIPSKDGAGNQCCYNTDGTLKYSQLSNHGSTPDRSHAWGAYPYNGVDRVPELSHWKHDVVSFYYCCLWNSYKLCDLYMAQRPTADCRYYEPPGIGFVHGHTHISTFDGRRYHFAGSGDYWLAQHNPSALKIQGKFLPRTESWDMGRLRKINTWKPKTLTALAMSAGSKHIQVAVTPVEISSIRGIDILIDGEHQYFLEKSSFWQDFQGFSVINNALSVKDNRHNNFTFLLTTYDIGVNVVAVNGLLHVSVAVSPRYKTSTGGNLIGLLGRYDGNIENDYTSRRGQLISPFTGKKEIFETFAQSWKMNGTDYDIFKVETPGADLDPLHSFFDYSDIPSDFEGAPNQNTIGQLCGSNENCRWDFQITGEASIAQTTLNADGRLGYLRKSSLQVDNCGLPEIGAVALNSENFTVSQEVTVTKCTNGKSVGSGVTFRCTRELLSEAKDKGHADYGITRIDSSSNEAYIFHWVPKPYTVCSDDKDDSSNLAMIIGIAVGAAVLVIIIIIIVVIVVRRKKSGKSREKESPTPVERGRREPGKDTGRDPAAAEAMLSKVEDRSPVYKPSAGPVRMSELREGSNV